MEEKISKAISLFFCYAPEDESLCQEFESHLSPLRRVKQITSWLSRDIVAGTDWAHEIETHLHTASIILLLISPDFIASDYCYTTEMQIALDRYRAGKAYVVPIIVRPVHWEITPLGQLPVLPLRGQPVTLWPNRDAVWLAIAQKVSELVNMLLVKESVSSEEMMALLQSQDSGSQRQLDWLAVGVQADDRGAYQAGGRITSMPTERAPRVFLSYARADGEPFATQLRQRLQAEHIPLWQDRVGMEGGRDWWQQITEALDHVEFLVLVMTPAAMQSEMVRKEWRYARQQGVCVYPVKGQPDLDFTSLPHWMRSAHFYDLNYEWQKLVNDLNTRCQQTRVPFMVEDLPADYVARPQEFVALIEKLLDQRREEPIAITAALRRTGGYGKTTMAKALCHDERIQQAFDDGILWVTLGEHPGNLVGKVEDLIYMLSHERPGFTDTVAVAARLAELLAERDILLVVDDAWDAMHLKPFLQGGKRCARLVTTRNEDVLPTRVQSLVVDAMQPDEAVQLLSSGLQTGTFTATDLQALRSLVARLGEWALLLKLANAVLRDRVGRGEALANALVYLNKALDKRGLTAFDAENVQARDAAVSASLRVSFDLLEGEQYARYQELVVFPEDVNIPLITLQKLWGATGGMDDFDTEELCETLYRHSLLLKFDLATRTIRLHDVIRNYLQKAVGAALPALHAHLLDAYHLERWADLPDDEPYLWDYLPLHLIAAGRLAELVATMKDLRYLANKSLVRTAYAAEADLAFAEQQVPADAPLRLLTRNFANMGHILKRCRTYHDLAAVLYSRLVHLQELSDLCQTFEQDIPRPYLTSWHLLPDLPDPALIRTLSGHTGYVWGCAINPEGDTIVSASADGTLKLWELRTGEERRTLRGHTAAVRGCAISPAGDTIVSASDDATLKVWDARTGEERRTLYGHTDGVRGCAISPAGDYIVSASRDQTLKIWDAHTGKERRTLRGHAGEVEGCAISPSGDAIVSASHDQTLKVWDAATGEELRTLRGHTDSVRGCVFSPSGNYIMSASNDWTLRVWDAHTGACLSTLCVNENLNTGVFHPDGEHIVAVGASGVYFLRWVR